MNFSKIIITVVFINIFIFNSFGQNLNKAEADKVWQNLETGKTEDTFWYLVNLYQQNGADFKIGDRWGLKLKVQDYKEIINQYSNGMVEIKLSRMMKPEETADYWGNWSKVLAKGNFDQKKFFKNDRERFLMANFNVLVLAAHEIGHYLDYRYQINDRFFEGGMLTTKTPMNCVENYADKFAVATINYLAQDSRFAEIRSRYLELINNFNSSIPTENRYNFDSYDYVREKCETVDLYKNGVNEDGSGVNENFFRQYTSAYFNRHRLMLENKNYPNLKGVIEEDLVDPYLKLHNYSKTKFTVRTISEFNFKNHNDIFYGGKEFREMLEFNHSLSLEKKIKENVSVSLKTDVLNEKGEIKILEFSWIARQLPEKDDDEKLILKENGFSLKILNAKEKVTDSVKVTIPKELQNEFIITKAILPTDNEIIAILTPFDLKKNFDHVVIVRLLKDKKKWNQKVVKFTVPNLTNADEIAENWFVTPNGKLNLLQKVDKDKETLNLTQYEIDRPNFTARIKRQTFTVKIKDYFPNRSRKEGRWVAYLWGGTISGNEAGKLMVSGYEFESALSSSNLFLINETPETLLGNINGKVDGDNPRDVRVSNISETRFIAENRLVFIDTYNDKSYLREVILP